MLNMLKYSIGQHLQYLAEEICGIQENVWISAFLNTFFVQGTQ